MDGIASSLPALASMAQQAPAPAVNPAETKGIQPAQNTQQISQDAGVQQPQPTPPTSHPIRDLLSNFASQFSMNLGDYLVERGGGSNPHTAQNLADNRLRTRQLDQQQVKDLAQIQREGELNKLTAQQTEKMQQMYSMVPATDAHEKVSGGAIKTGQLIPRNVSDYLLNQTAAGARASESANAKKLVAGYGEEGKPLPIDQLAIPTQMKAQMAGIQQQLQQANLDAKNADPNTAAGRKAITELQIKMQNARSAATKAAAASGMTQVAQQKYVQDYIQSSVGLTDNDGNPIGYKAAQLLSGDGKLTSATRTMAETAPKVIDLANRVDQLTTQLGSRLGPGGSRLSEVMAGKVGAADPEFTKLRTDVGLLQTALMRMHVGARGGQQIMEHFKDLIDSGKQSPENLHAALGEITTYAKDVASQGASGGSVKINRGGRTATPQASGGGDEFAQFGGKKH